jgi:hypothetical protein
VRGTTVAGWTTAAQTVAVPVTIEISEPVLDCRPGDATLLGDYTFSWSAVTGAAEYRIYTATRQDGSYTPFRTVPGNQTEATMNVFFRKRFVRVTAVVGTTESASSNAIQLQGGFFTRPTCEKPGS